MTVKLTFSTHKSENSTCTSHTSKQDPSCQILFVASSSIQGACNEFCFKRHHCNKQTTGVYSESFQTQCSNAVHHRKTKLYFHMITSTMRHTRNSAIADKPLDASMQIQWSTVVDIIKSRPSSYVTVPNLVVLR